MTTKSERRGASCGRAAFASAMQPREGVAAAGAGGGVGGGAGRLDGWLEPGGLSDRFAERTLEPLPVDLDRATESPVAEAARLTAYRDDPGADHDEGPHWIRYSAWSAVALMAAAALVALVTFDPAEIEIRAAQAEEPSRPAGEPVLAPAGLAATGGAPQVVELASARATGRGGPLFAADGRRVLAAGAPLSEGSSVETHARAACLTVDSGVEVCLGPETRVALESLHQTARVLRVLRGGAVASVQPQPAGLAFALVAGEARAEAAASVFGVFAGDGSAEVDVRVVDGEVRVGAGGALVQLQAGRAARIAADHGMHLRKLTAAVIERVWALAGTGEPTTGAGASALPARGL